MFDHVTLRVRSLDESIQFYDRLFELLGFEGTRYADDTGAIWDDFGFYVGPPYTRGLEVVFAAPSAVSIPAVDPNGTTLEAVERPGGGGGVAGVRLCVRSVEESLRFYRTVAPVLGIDPTERISFAESPEPTENFHLAFPAPDDATVDEFHRVALAAG